MLVFALSVALLIHIYFMFPGGLWLLSRLRPVRPRRDPDYRPRVSLLLAAYDEEACIAARLRNLAELRYPLDRLEILLGSDGSTDRTVELAHHSNLGNLKVLEFSERRGKVAVLNELASLATGEILAFTDANTRWAPDVLERLVSHFADPQVGGVSGRLRLCAASRETQVEQGYWDLESALKSWESGLGTTIGANGAIYAIRADLWRPLPEDRPLMDDFVVGCRVVEAGYRLLFDPEAQAWEPTTGSLEAEVRRKRRIFVANFCAVPILRRLLRPGLPAVFYLSHKLLRWLTPLWLLGLLVTSAAMNNTLHGQTALCFQLVLYGGAFAFWMGQRFGRILGPLAPLYYFVCLQGELIHALLVALLGHPDPAWERSARPGVLRPAVAGSGAGPTGPHRPPAL